VHYEGSRAKPQFVVGKPVGSPVVQKKESIYINLCMTGLKERFVSSRPSGKVLLMLVGQASLCNEFQMLDLQDRVTLRCRAYLAVLQPLDRTFSSL